MRQATRSARQPPNRANSESTDRTPDEQGVARHALGGADRASDPSGTSSTTSTPTSCPAARIVRLDELKASMQMGQPFPGVWLPASVGMRFAMTLAIGRVSRAIRHHVPQLSTAPRSTYESSREAAPRADARLAWATPAVAQVTEQIVEIRIHGNHTTPDADVLAVERSRRRRAGHRGATPGSRAEAPGQSPVCRRRGAPQVPVDRRPDPDPRRRGRGRGRGGDERRI